MTNYILIIIIFLLPLQFALNLGDNFDLVTTKVLVPVVFLLWLLRGLAHKYIWVPNKAETWLVVLFLFLSFVSLVLGRDADEGARKILYFLTIFPVFFVAADIFQKPKWRQVGVIAVISSGLIAALVALLQFSFPFFVGIGKAVRMWENLAPFFLGNSFGKLVAANSSWLVNIGGKTLMRAFGFFPDPHNFAFFVNLCLFLGVGYFFWQKKVTRKVWIGFGIILMFISVLLSFSRGAYLGLIAGVIFFVAIFLKRSGLLWKTFAVIGLVLILLFVFKSSVVSQRLASSFNLKEGSNAERYKNWVEAVSIICDYPLAGVGLGNYARAVDPTAPDRSSIYAHNLFLDIAAETGILNAVVVFLLLLVSIWRNVKNGDMLDLGIAAGLVIYSIHSIFDTALYSPQALTMLLVIIALGIDKPVIASEAKPARIDTQSISFRQSRV